MRYFFDLFGCAKNQVDAENMMALLNKSGWESTNAEDADLIIVNSCGFIESAKQESIEAVFEWRKLYPGKKILLAGCLAQRYAKELSESLNEADGFFGVEDISQIVPAACRLFAGTFKQEQPLIETCAAQGERPLLSLPGSAYVKISEGCSNNCSYCAIPIIRGSLKSRSIPDITEECRALLARGIKELCIVAQDVGSFSAQSCTALSGADDTKLPELLNAVSMLEGNFWVRLLYIHPDNFPLRILDIMERDSRILPYFDIPFQHASEKILKAMNRRGTAEKYLELLRTIRERLPGAVIRSTFLLGFPGETEEDFAALLDFQEKAALDWLGCFTWSREEGTPAYSMKNRISKKTAAMRKQIIEERQIPITEKSMDRFIGKKLEVLIEEQIGCGTDEESEDIWLGRLYCHAPEVDGTAVITGSCTEKLQAGMLVPCKVIARRGFDLKIKIKYTCFSGYCTL